jgi:hypothetical protein
MRAVQAWHIVQANECIQLSRMYQQCMIKSELICKK